MSKQREALEIALDALEDYQTNGAPFFRCDSAVAAIREALAEPFDPVQDAAPDLLEALESMLQSFLITQSLDDYSIDAPCNKARAAIAKAKGEV